MAKSHDPQPEPDTSSEYEESGTESEPEESELQKTLARAPPPPQPRANTEVSESGSETDGSSEDEPPPQTEPVAVVQKPGSIKKSKSAQASTVSSKLTGTKRGADMNASSDKLTKKIKKEDILIQKDNINDAKKTCVDCETVLKLPNFEAPQWLREALNIGSEMFERGKVREGSKEWKTIKHREMDLYLKLLQLNVDKTRLAFDAIKSKDL